MRLVNVSMTIVALILAGCELSSADNGIGEAAVEYRIEYQDDWPERGDGFTLRVHRDGQASVQRLPWDARARFAPAPIVSLGKLSGADLELFRELFALEIPTPRTGLPQTELIYPTAHLALTAELEEPGVRRTLSRLYQPHFPSLPASVFHAIDRMRELYGETADGDWESSARLESPTWIQGETIIGGARFLYRGQEPVTLHFSSGCQMRRVLIDGSGTAYPEDRMCTMALTQLDFVRGQGHDFRLDFDSGSPPDGWPRDASGGLPVGSYILRAELNDLHAEVEFEVRPRP